MAKRIRLFGPQLIDTTAETVFTNVTGTAARLESLTIAQPAAGLAKTVRLAIGLDSTLANRWFEYPVPAGAGTFIFYPNVVLTGTDVLQLVSSADDDVAVATGSGSVEAV